jgi:hypothetical protein
MNFLGRRKIRETNKTEHNSTEREESKEKMMP